MKAILSTFVAVVASLHFAVAAQAEDYICTGQSGTWLSKADTVTGSGTNIGNTGTNGTWAAAIDNNDGTIYTLVNWGQYLGTINPSTGAVTLIGSAHFTTTMICLEVSDDGTLYGVDWSAGLWTINKTTGVRTLVGYGSAYNAMDLAFDSDGTLWMTTMNALFTIDTSTGASMMEANISGVSSGEIMSISFDSNGTLFGMPWIPNAPLYSINTGTGAATSIGNTGLYYPHGGDILVVLDTDGDGVNDDDDHCINSDLGPTVVIAGRDSGVPNTLNADGCTISDLLAECAANSANHGAYVSCVAECTNALVKAGVITGKQKGAIQSCAAKSNIGK